MFLRIGGLRRFEQKGYLFVERERERERDDIYWVQ
jgi:hypothetical protein